MQRFVYSFPENMADVLMAIMMYAGISNRAITVIDLTKNIYSKTFWRQIRILCELVNLMNVKAGLKEI